MSFDLAKEGTMDKEMKKAAAAPKQAASCPDAKTLFAAE